MMHINRKWKEIFDNLASTQDGLPLKRESLDARDSGIYQNIREELAEVLATREIHPPALWLDIGSGTCRIAQDFSPLGYRVVSSDLSFKLLRRSKQMFSPGGLGSVASDVSKLPFPDNSFDVVSAFGLFPLVDHPKAALQEVLRALAPGGTALIEFLNRHSLFYHATVWASYVLPRHFANLKARDHLIRRDTLRELRVLLNGLPGVTIQIRYLVHLPLPGFLACRALFKRLSALLGRCSGGSLFLSHAFLVCLRKED